MICCLHELEMLCMTALSFWFPMKHVHTRFSYRHIHTRPQLVQTERNKKAHSFDFIWWLSIILFQFWWITFFLFLLFFLHRFHGARRWKNWFENWIFVKLYRVYQNGLYADVSSNRSIWCDVQTCGVTYICCEHNKELFGMQTFFIISDSMNERIG